MKKSNINTNRPRISFLNRKTKRSSIKKDRKESLSLLSDLLNGSNESESEIEDRSEIMGGNTQEIALNQSIPSNLTAPGSIHKIYENLMTKECIYLLRNKIDFCLVGKGVLRVIFGKVDLFGYEISSENDMDDYPFDISEIYPLYTCYNKGKTVEDLDKIIQDCRKFTSSDKLDNNVGNKIKTNVSINTDRITIIYFKEISNNFKILSEKEILEDELDYINLHKYDNYIEGGYDSRKREMIERLNLSENRKFIICGKKNSGKSTFTLFLLNKLLSKIKDTIRTEQTKTTHPFLFFIDCDSGQPLLSSPFTVSFMKLNQPIIQNYYNESNTLLMKEMIRSLLVEENTPANNFEEYINCVKSLIDTFNQIPNKSNHYLVVNTNGYTSGLGNVINSSILDILNSDVAFFVKNFKAGRAEKGEEFENYVVREEEKNSLGIILRKLKIDSMEQASKVNKYKRNKSFNMESRTVLVRNEFELRDEENLGIKNLNKNLYMYANIIGEDFSLNKGIYKRTTTLNDFLYSPKITLPLIEIPFDNIIFSFNFSEFKPKSDLDILLAINAKMCFILQSNESASYKYEIIDQNSNMKLINFEKLPVGDRKFHSFGYIYNINIIKRKLVLISDKLSKESDRINFSYIIHRNISALDKSFQAVKESKPLLERILMAKKRVDLFAEIPVKNEKNEKNGIITQNSKKSKQELYFTRNKYSII